MNFSLFEMKEFDECCNSHDICYGSCKVDKKTCDHDFYSCLTNSCNLFGSREKWTEYQIAGRVIA